MNSEQPSIAFALGGLAGNNAHGAGFLHSALKHQVKPAMISCTSGQIYWTYEFLRARQGEPEQLRKAFYSEIEDLHRYHNINVDYSRIAFFGRAGVFRPAYYEYLHDLINNTARAMSNFIAAPTRSFWAKELMDALPGRLLIPEFPPDFFQQISDAFNSEQTIGIAFNSYSPTDGQEFVYLNDAARHMLAPAGQKYFDGYQSGTRQRTVYREITPEAIKAGLWIYEYGFEDSEIRHVDGAYYRQIMLKELTSADIIVVVRPISHQWLPGPSTNQSAPAYPLPRGYAEMQDLKTEIGFNGTYIGERAQIELINQLVAQRDLALARDGGDVATDLLRAYHQIDLIEIEIEVQRSFFDYIFENPEIFEQAVSAFERRIAAGDLNLRARQAGT